MYNLISRGGWLMGGGAGCKQLKHSTFLQHEALALVIQRSEVHTALSVASHQKGMMISTNHKTELILLNHENKAKNRQFGEKYGSTRPASFKQARVGHELHRLNTNPRLLSHPGDGASLLGDRLSVEPSANLQDLENLISHKSYMIPTNLDFKSSSKNSAENSNAMEGNKPDLDKVAFELTYELVNTFVKNSDWTIYHHDLIFEDRIRGKRLEGLLNYIKFINFAKVIAHLRFVYVRFHILNLSKHKEDNTVRIRWRVAGLSMTRLILRYIPDRMWRRGNMDKSAPTWYDGYSVFYVGPDNKIYKHVVDRRMPDQDKESVLNPVVEKLKKLKEAPASVPTM